MLVLLLQNKIIMLVTESKFLRTVKQRSLRYAYNILESGGLNFSTVLKFLEV